MAAEYNCEGCGWHIVAVALQEPPAHRLCAQCAFLCETIPDPEEMVSVHKWLNRERAR